MHLFFLKAALEVGKEPDGDEFLVSKLRHMVIAHTLKTSGGRAYRKCDRQTGRCELVDFPWQENSTKSAVCLSFLLLIRINIPYRKILRGREGNFYTTP